MKLAIYGYDTIVGKLVLELLEDSPIVIEEFYPLSPLASEYDAVPLRGKNYEISYVDEFDFSQAQVALFLTTKDESERLVPLAQSQGCIVIDNSHLFSGVEAAPVVLKEINPYDIDKVVAKKLSSIPLATSSEIVLALNPLHDEFGVKQAVVTAMISASEHGELGTQTLAKETTLLLNGMSVDVTDFPSQLAFNVHTRIGELDDLGVSEHENIVKHEVFSLLDDFAEGLSLTCIQVPTFYGHTLSIHVKLEEDCALEDFKQVLSDNEAIALEELLEGQPLVTPVSCADSELEGKLFVSRIRKSGRAEFDFTVVMDNTRHGEATNALDILEVLQKKLA